MTTIEPRKAIRGDDRAALTRNVRDRYFVGGEPIRAIATDLGRSYGFVHTLLTDTGLVLRRPGRRVSP